MYENNWVQNYWGNSRKSSSPIGGLLFSSHLFIRFEIAISTSNVIAAELARPMTATFIAFAKQNATLCGARYAYIC